MDGCLMSVVYLAESDLGEISRPAAMLNQELWADEAQWLHSALLAAALALRDLRRSLLPPLRVAIGGCPFRICRFDPCELSP